jgi:hypothetical protein
MEMQNFSFANRRVRIKKSLSQILFMYGNMKLDNIFFDTSSLRFILPPGPTPHSS